MYIAFFLIVIFGCGALCLCKSAAVSDELAENFDKGDIE